MIGPSLLGAPRLERLVAEARATPPGAIVEAGVYAGGSAVALATVAQDQHRTLWLYDTFGPGIPHADPDKGDSHRVGDFADGLTYAEARDAFPGARVIAGVFPWPGVPLPPAIAFAHLDCDQYRSVKEALEVLFPRMVPGGVIAIDDYGLAGCALACHEARDRGHDLRFRDDGRAYFQC